VTAPDRPGVPGPRDAVGLALLVALALGVRALRWHGTSLMFNDGPAFLTLAQAVAAGDWTGVVSHPYHPLYPAVVAVVHFLVPSWEGAAAAVSIACGGVSVGLLWALLRRAFGRDAAWLGALFLAVQPRAIEQSSDVQSDGLYLALFLAGALALWLALERRRAALAAWTGVLAGLAYLTRPEGIGIVLAGGLLLALEAVRRRMPPGRAVALALVMGAALLLVMAPYLVALRTVGGSWSLTQKKSVGRLLLLEAGPAPESLAAVEAARDAAGAAPGTAAARPRQPPPAGAAGPGPPGAEAPPAWALELRRAGRAVSGLWDAIAKAARPWFLVLLVAGAWLRRGWPGPGGRFVLAFLAVYLPVLLAQSFQYGYVSGRHVMPLLALCFGYLAPAVRTLAGLARRAAARAGRPGLSERAAVAGVLALVVAVALGQALKPERPRARAARAAADWLAAQPAAPGAVAAGKGRLAWYAGRPHVPFYGQPRGEAFLASLRSGGARYLIARGADLDEFPELREGEGRPLRLLHVASWGGEEARVYELAEAEPTRAQAPAPAPAAVGPSGPTP